jgi:hypothetical protein
VQSIGYSENIAVTETVIVTANVSFRKNLKSFGTVK